MIDFLKVVIFTCHPEDRNMRYAPINLIQLFADVYDRCDFKDGKHGASEQAKLMSRGNCDAVLALEFLEVKFN